MEFNTKILGGQKRGSENIQLDTHINKIKVFCKNLYNYNNEYKYKVKSYLILNDNFEIFTEIIMPKFNIKEPKFIGEGLSPTCDTHMCSLNNTETFKQTWIKEYWIIYYTIQIYKNKNWICFHWIKNNDKLKNELLPIYNNFEDIYNILNKYDIEFFEKLGY
tara:strand:+ start:7943 stop:8428 length:486 start_codon:yes stop_codon:yes gene_type:complete